MSGPDVRHDYLLVYEIDDDKLRFGNEKVMYKFNPGPPWEHFVYFDRVSDVVRAYRLVMLCDAHSARVTHRELTTVAAEPEELDMAVLNVALRKERAANGRKS